MNVLQKAKIQLAKLLNLEFESISTDKGELEYDGELEVGTEVFVSDEEGNLTIPENGDYIAGSITITVEGGKVAGLNSSEEMDAQEDIEEVPEQTGEYAESEAFNELVDVVNTLIDEVQVIKDEAEEFKKKNAELQKQQQEFSRQMNMSVDKPANQIVKIEEKTNQSQLSKFGL